MVKIDLKKIKQQRPTVSRGAGLGHAILHKELSFGKILTDKRKEDFYSELVVLITSGLDLKGALDMLSEAYKNKKLRQKVSGMGEMILQGASFSETIFQTKDFSAYEYYSLKIGEESGCLIEVMQELSVFYQKKIKQRKQLITAFSYPMLILFTAFGAVFFMLNYIVPLFADAFLRFNSDLPALTQNVIALSQGFKQYWYVIPLVIASCLLFYRIFKSHTWYRKLSSKVVLNIPLLGSLWQKVYLARFCQSMGLMSAAQIPLIRALDLISKMIQSYLFEEAIDQVKEDVFNGDLLHKAMEKHRIFEAKVVALVKVAEQTNRLDFIFNRLHEQYTEEVDHKTGLISSMLEPVLIILVGGMVALILIAMYLPMFKLGGALMAGF